jgi:hypothetical protein
MRLFLSFDRDCLIVVSFRIVRRALRSFRRVDNAFASIPGTKQMMD